MSAAGIKSISSSVKAPTRGVKRPADEDTTGNLNASNLWKKAKVETEVVEIMAKTEEKAVPEKLEDEDEDGGAHEEEDAVDEDGNKQISKDEPLDYIDGMISGLSKRFLKAVMSEVGCYGGGTNADMAANIVSHLEEMAHGGEDLLYEEKAFKRVYEDCWGGCVGTSDGEEEDY